MAKPSSATKENLPKIEVTRDRHRELKIAAVSRGELLKDMCDTVLKLGLQALKEQSPTGPIDPVTP